VKEAREVLIHVRRGDQFLVTHRVPAGGGYWHTIAGCVEPGEEWEAVEPVPHSLTRLGL